MKRMPNRVIFFTLILLVQIVFLKSVFAEKSSSFTEIQKIMSEKKKEDEEKIIRLQFSANKGDVKAQMDLATIYRKGSRSQPNPDYMKAIEWYTKAANQNNVEAQIALAEMYSWGEGVKDWRKGVEWYTKAAEQGDKRAQFELAEIYSHGPTDNTVENNREIINQEKAFFWHKKSADQGSAGSQSMVGTAYMLGRGVEQDNQKAIEWFTKAAEQGSTFGQYQLGKIYAEGKLVPQNAKQAYKWLDLSIRMEGKRAILARDEIAKTMTPEQIIEAQALVKEWKANRGQ